MSLIDLMMTWLCFLQRFLCDLFKGALLSLTVYIEVTCVSCVSQEGLVYAVEFSHRSGRDLLNVAKKRTNIIPIIEDARHPHKYRMLVGR